MSEAKLTDAELDAIEADARRFIAEAPAHMRGRRVEHNLLRLVTEARASRALAAEARLGRPHRCEACGLVGGHADDCSVHVLLDDIRGLLGKPEPGAAGGGEV